MAPHTMHVNNTNFWPNLVLIIEAISDADHVSIDLAPSALKSAFPEDRWLDSLKPPKVERVDWLYYKAREVTETKGVFRAGLACSRYDEETKSYRIQSFHFDLTQDLADTLVKPDLKLPSALYRTLLDAFMVSELPSTIDEKFKAGVAEGIPTWSRAATLEALEVIQQWDFIDARDPGREKRIRKRVMSTPYSLDMRLPRTMSNNIKEKIMEMKSIYRVVDAKFPTCRVVLVRPWHLVVQDKDSSDDFKSKEKLRLWKPEDKREHIGMIGFQYVIEALVGGSFATQINPQFLLPQGAPPPAVSAITMRLQAAQNKLQTHRPILVTHNPLLDLCFLKAQFLSCGQSTIDGSGLPPTLDDFSAEMHALFPRIADMKYLCSSWGAKEKTLPALYERYSQSVPPRSPKIVFEKFAANPVGGTAMGGSRNVGDAGLRAHMAAFVFIQASAEKARLNPGLCLSSDPGHGPGHSEADEPKPTPSQDLMRAFGAVDRAGLGSSVSGPVSKQTGGICDGSCVPEWDTPFWERYGNRMRMGRRKVWELKGYSCLAHSEDEKEEVLVDV